MAEEDRELARLERRIAEVRHASEQSRHDRGSPFNAADHDRMMVLLRATLGALEARKAQLELVKR